MQMLLEISMWTSCKLRCLHMPPRGASPLANRSNDNSWPNYSRAQDTAKASCHALTFTPLLQRVAIHSACLAAYAVSSPQSASKAATYPFKQLQESTIDKEAAARCLSCSFATASAYARVICGRPVVGSSGSPAQCTSLFQGRWMGQHAEMLPLGIPQAAKIHMICS